MACSPMSCSTLACSTSHDRARLTRPRPGFPRPRMTALPFHLIQQRWQGARDGTLLLMREAFAHEAVLSMAPEADLRAPGAAITVALCGHWAHEPPCPLAPHHSRAERVGDDVRVRTLFAAEPERERAVRELIDRALSRGQLPSLGGVRTQWQLRSSQHSVVSAQERDQAQRLVRT